MIKEETKPILKFNAEGIHPADMWTEAKKACLKAVDEKLYIIAAIFAFDKDFPRSFQPDGFTKLPFHKAGKALPKLYLLRICKPGRSIFLELKVPALSVSSQP